MSIFRETNPMDIQKPSLMGFEYSSFQDRGFNGVLDYLELKKKKKQEIWIVIMKLRDIGWYKWM